MRRGGRRCRRVASSCADASQCRGGGRAAPRNPVCARPAQRAGGAPGDRFPPRRLPAPGPASRAVRENLDGRLAQDEFFMPSSPGARSANRGSSRTCEVPVWIPARPCAPSGMTYGLVLRIVRDDDKRSATTFLLPSPRKACPREGGGGDPAVLAGRSPGIPARRCAPSGMTYRLGAAGRPGWHQKRGPPVADPGPLPGLNAPRDRRGCRCGRR